MSSPVATVKEISNNSSKVNNKRKNKPIFKPTFEHPYLDIPDGLVSVTSDKKDVLLKDIYSSLGAFCRPKSESKGANKINESDAADQNAAKKARIEKAKVGRLTGSKLYFGINDATERLEAYTQSMKGTEAALLKTHRVALMLCRDDSKPTLIVNHLIVMARLCKVPFILLPAGSASDLATFFNVPRFSTLAVLLETTKATQDQLDEKLTSESLVKIIEGIERSRLSSA